jgi:hypothetical protein
MYSYGGDPVTESDATPIVTRQTDEIVMPEAKAG